MLRSLIALTATLALLVPLSASAAGKADKAPKPLKHLQLLVDEQAAQAEDGLVSDDMLKALKAADRCMKDDAAWDRALKDSYPIDSVVDLVQSAVGCWQRAEKKAGRLGEVSQPSVLYFAARARHLESFRSYLWGVQAKQAGDRHSTCKRMKVAVQEAAAANQASQALPAKFRTEAAIALATKQDADSEAMGNTILTEYQNQKCE